MRKLTLLLVAALVAVTSFAQKAQREAPQAPALQLKSAIKMEGKKADAQTLFKNHQPKIKAVGRRHVAKVSQMITEQPEGTLVLFERDGRTVNYNTSTYSLSYGSQKGLVMNVVVAPDGKTMYLQNPLSQINTGVWVKGTLNEDGTLLTVPLGQTIYQDTSFGYGIELAMYDIEKNDNGLVTGFNVDMYTNEVTYTISGNTIKLNGTSENRFLGAIYDDDMEWTGYGDLESEYTVFTKSAVTLPAGLQTEEWQFSAGYSGSYSYYLFNNPKALLAFDGNDVYLQGFNDYLPEAWIKGVKNADGSLTFPSGQFMGLYNNTAIYFAGYNDETFGVDVTFAFNGKDAYVTKQYIIINGKPDTMYYYTYSMPGSAISHEKDELVEVPAGAQFEDYVMTYSVYDSEEGPQMQKVKVAFAGNEVFVAGLFSEMPAAVIKGVINGDKIIFDGTQYLGQYVDYDEAIDLYVLACEQEEYLLDQIEFIYDAEKKTFESYSDLCVSVLRHALYYYEYYAIPDFAPFVDSPAVPATPAVVEFDEWTTSWSGDEYALVGFNMDDTDENGAKLFTDQLYYRLYSDVERDIQPIVFNKDLYGLEEDMIDVPYDYTDDEGNFYDWGSWAAFFGYNKEVALLDPACQNYSRIGVQAVYKGGGVENVSPIAWLKIKDYTDTLTWVAADQGFENFQFLGEEDMAEGYIISFSLGENKNDNAPRYYNEDKSARIYKHNEFTLAGRKLMGAVIYTAADAFLPNLSASEGTIVKDEENLCYYWTGKTSAVTFANDELGENTQLRITRIDLRYGEKAGGTVDPTVLVEVPADAQIVDYTLNATAYAWNGENYVEIPRSEIVKVAFSDEDIYVQGIGGIYSQFADAWVKGTIDGDKVVFMSRQLMGTVGQSSMYFVGSDAVSVLDDIEFDWDAEQHVLTSPEDALVVLNADVNELAPYAYYTQITLTEGGLMPVVVPEDLVVEPYVMTYSDYYEKAGYDAVNVGFSGNEVYVQGLCSYLPEAWVVGTIDGNTVTFAGDQYFGNYDGYDFLFSQSPVQFAYDAETGALASDGLMYTYYGDGSSYYYADYFMAPKLTKVIEMAGTPADPTIDGIRESNYGPILEYTIPLVDTEGHNMLASKLSYQLFSEVKGEVSPVVLTPAAFVKLTEDMTVIPYTFSDNYDIYNNMLYMNMNFSTWDKVGIKSIYEGGGEKHESNISWFSLTETVRGADDAQGINAVVADSDATYTDLQGRAVTAAAKGMIIMQVRQADGTVKATKVIRK